jgi:isopenicillin N synthase-like dioxygenase
MGISFNYIDINDEIIFEKRFEVANKLFECPLKEKNKIRIRRDYHRGYENDFLSETFLYGSNQYLKNIFTSLKV